MSAPDPEQFARTVLWHLTGLNARLQSLESRLIANDIISGESDAASEDQMKRVTDELHQRLYREAIEAARLSSPPTDDPGNGVSQD